MPSEPRFGNDGLPERITPEDFKRYHLQSFPKLADDTEFLLSAIDTVYAMFAGVGTIWKRHTKPVWCDKTWTCYRHLVAWYIADMYPNLVSGVAVVGGVPIRRKKIGGVDITFQNANTGDGKTTENLLGGLDSNPFGKMAKMMITTAGERFIIRNRTRVSL
jgi:hypothetical protein